MVILQIYKVVLKLLLRVNSWTFLLFLFIGVFVPNLPRCCLAHIQSHLRNNHDHMLPTSTRTLPILFWNRTNASNFCRNWSRSVNRFFRRSNKYTSAWRNAQKRAPAKRQRLFLYLQDLFCKDLFSFVQVTNGSSLQQKILVCFQGIIRSADSKLRIISLRSRPYSYGLCGGGNAWKC